MTDLSWGCGCAGSGCEQAVSESDCGVDAVHANDGADDDEVNGCDVLSEGLLAVQTVYCLE